MSDLVKDYINLRMLLASGMRDGRLLSFDDSDDLRRQFSEMWLQMSADEQRQAYTEWHGKEPPKREACDKRSQDDRRPLPLPGCRVNGVLVDPLIFRLARGWE